jgi:hypothetical protein
MPIQRNIEDAGLRAEFALPAAASTNTVSAPIDLGPIGNGIRPENVELELEVPALNATILPNSSTATLSVEASDVDTFASGVEVLRSVTLTGAGGQGSPGAKLRSAIPSNGKRFVRGKVAFGPSTSDGSALSAKFALKF